MNFRVYVIIETPILDKKYELLVPIDRRIYEIIDLLKREVSFPDGNQELTNEQYLEMI